MLTSAAYSKKHTSSSPAHLWASPATRSSLLCAAAVLVALAYAGVAVMRRSVGEAALVGVVLACGWVLGAANAAAASPWALGLGAKARVKPLVISVEGNIGAGKTTFLRTLLEMHRSKNAELQYLTSKNIQVVPEPIEEWFKATDGPGGQSIFDLYYHNKERWAYTFQTFVLLTKYNALKAALKKVTSPTNGDIVFVERCMNTDKYVFMAHLTRDGHIRPIETKLYDSWHASFLEDYDVSGYIYLHTSVLTAQDRIRSRNRQSEGGIDVGYLEGLHEAHVKWMDKAPVIGKDCDEERLLSSTTWQQEFLTCGAHKSVSVDGKPVLWLDAERPMDLHLLRHVQDWCKATFDK